MGILDKLRSSSLQDKKRKLRHLEAMEAERKAKLEQAISLNPQMIEVMQRIEENNAAILRLMTIGDLLTQSRDVTVREICGSFEQANPFSAETLEMAKLKAAIGQEEQDAMAKHPMGQPYRDYNQVVEGHMKKVYDHQCKQLENLSQWQSTKIVK